MHDCAANATVQFGTALQKVQKAEDLWNTCDPQRVADAYTVNSQWRNRSEFFSGRAAIVSFLGRKWTEEKSYRLCKELWAFQGNRIAVKFFYESVRVDGNWIRSYGNEMWEFAANGLMESVKLLSTMCPYFSPNAFY